VKMSRRSAGKGIELMLKWDIKINLMRGAWSYIQGWIRRILWKLPWRRPYRGWGVLLPFPERYFIIQPDVYGAGSDKTIYSMGVVAFIGYTEEVPWIWVYGTLEGQLFKVPGLASVDQELKNRIRPLTEEEKFMLALAWGWTDWPKSGIRL
jgi:hypothetical protein